MMNQKPLIFMKITAVSPLSGTVHARPTAKSSSFLCAFFLHFYGVLFLWSTYISEFWQAAQIFSILMWKKDRQVNLWINIRWKISMEAQSERQASRKTSNVLNRCEMKDIHGVPQKYGLTKWPSDCGAASFAPSLTLLGLSRILLSKMHLSEWWSGSYKEGNSVGTRPSDPQTTCLSFTNVMFIWF